MLPLAKGVNVVTDKRHAETAEVLLSKSADVNAKTKDDATTLMWAAQEGHTEIVRLLKQAGPRNDFEKK